MAYISLKGMFIMLLFGVVFYNYQLVQVVQDLLFTYGFVFGLLILSITERGVLKYLFMTVSFLFLSLILLFLLHNFEPLLLSLYKCNIVNVFLVNYLFYSETFLVISFFFSFLSLIMS